MASCDLCHGAPGSVYLHETLSIATGSDSSGTGPTKEKELLIIDGGGKKWSSSYFTMDLNSTTLGDDETASLEELRLLNNAAFHLSDSLTSLSITKYLLYHVKLGLCCIYTFAAFSMV